jgi:hypothetical protein
MDHIDQIIAYESGDLSDDETISLFQSLVNSGLAWQLQGHYGRTAKALIDAGYVTLPKPKHNHHSQSDLARGIHD